MILQARAPKGNSEEGKDGGTEQNEKKIDEKVILQIQWDIVEHSL